MFCNSFAMPDVFNDYFQLNNAIHVYRTIGLLIDYRLHLHTVSFGLKCINFKGCLLWNSLPRAISDINSHAVFTKRNVNATCSKVCSMFT